MASVNNLTSSRVEPIQINVAIIVLARMNSSRFPRKSVCEIAGIPLISYILHRLVPWAKLHNLEIIVAVEDLITDFEIAEISNVHRINCFDGKGFSPKERIENILSGGKYDYFFRINGDSPFVDTDLLELALSKVSNGNLEKPDFVTNLKPRTYPYGISVELCNSTLFMHYSKSGHLIHSENIFDPIYRDAKKIAMESIILENNSDLSSLHLTIDTPNDLDRINSILNGLEVSERRSATWRDIYASINPEIYTEKED